MALKRYGIFLAYPPTVDLRSEGLGRYLASFLKGAEGREDVRFVIVCPSWSPGDLRTLFRSEGVREDAFDLIHPSSTPLILRVYQFYQKLKPGRRGKAWFARAAHFAIELQRKWLRHFERRLASAYSLWGLVLILLEFPFVAAVAIAASPIAAFLAVRPLFRAGRTYFSRHLRPAPESLLGRARSILSSPKDDRFILRLYRQMENAESLRMLAQVRRVAPVLAWYSPTAFWPSFNQVKEPRLMCVPDVVLSEFPTAFATGEGGARHDDAFEKLEDAIYGGQCYVTYSDHVKYRTLVERYAIDEDRITTIHHAPHDMQPWIALNGPDASGEMERNYCRTLLRSALCKATNAAYAAGFANTSFRFIFYASQTRPNKNIVGLLRAFAHLLRKRHAGCKLVITGNPSAWWEINSFIHTHRLENDVLFLTKLSNPELSACYKLAALAVNPSLSEGGCPFTFTEALSVGTPVVMSRIAVTEEILVEQECRDVSLFDPYDWEDMAERMHWGLANRDRLLQIQSRVYAGLAGRTWKDVVDEHLAVLDRIATAATAIGRPA